MTSTFASGQLSYTSFLLLLCELFTDVTAIPPHPHPPGSQPGVRTPRSVFALTTREMQCLPGRIFNSTRSLLSLFPLDAPIPYTRIFLPQASSCCKSRCGYSQGASEHLPDLLCDSASRRPSGSQKPASLLPTGGIYSLSLRHSQLPPAREGRVMKGRTPGARAGGMQVAKAAGHGLTCGAVRQGVHSHPERWVQKCHFSPTMA